MLFLSGMAPGSVFAVEESVVAVEEKSEELHSLTQETLGEGGRGWEVVGVPRA